jgi:hypothetical protein
MTFVFRGRVNPRAVTWLEGFGQFKNPLTMGKEPLTFRLVGMLLHAPNLFPMSEITSVYVI